ncbi:RNA ligase 2 [Vibrio phage AG74]|uniref:RNA ligase 2 n=3 Tax=Thalassavirus TaxID=2948922 RepID=A0A4Y6E807_9CAUD|nr:RNA ligase [Vibrio phage Brizo]YP_010108204.1 RNA ligase [Vibrio phage AG74]YP_010114335.1 RNA ligase [Vibrio phage Gary]QQO89799.1 RNA ligase 2 [Vibrio phage GRLPWR]WBF69531.1 RNA ligase 2 [Vibrio phage IW18]QDF14569.1 RNA ligase 2 [Vibrio phage Brizo]QKN85018.1 RNA ligase 2 [Vibrio phage AG74]QQV88269.1 RNA ligase 2 [Vibrio phage Gary]
MEAIKYPSTGQFRNAAKFLQHNTPAGSLVAVVGTVKIHGTNGSMVMLEDGTIHFQSKSRVLDTHNDNSGFCNYMLEQPVEELFDKFITQYKKYYGKRPAFPIEIAGEWAGKGIQKGVAVSEVDKFFTIFGFRVGCEVDNGGKLIGWLTNHKFNDVSLHESRIYNAYDFGCYQITINTAMPQLATEQLQELTLEVEKECPVGKCFGVKGVGEGIVWTPVDDALVDNPGSWFKVKGQKHSVSKVTQLAAVDPEKLRSIQEFVDYAVTENRLEQGLQEVGLDMKLTGKFIGWVNKDIYKEEQDVLEANGLTMKEVGNLLSQKAREFYFSKM